MCKLLTWLLFQSMAAAMQAPCYGFGNLIGTLDKVIESDLDLVQKNTIGGQNNYLNSIDFFLDGRTFFQLGYKSKS